MTRDEILNMQAGHELNKLIAEFVFGMKLEKNHGFAGGYYWVGNGVLFGDVPAHGMPDYSTDIEAAWTVVEKMTDGETPNDFELRTSIRGWRCDFYKGYASAETAPLAICKAALLAVMK